MIDSCREGCPDYASCKSLCEKIKKELESLAADEYVDMETPISQINTYRELKNDAEEPQIDDSRKIDAAATFAVESDTEAQWDLNEITTSDMEDNDYKKFRIYLSRSEHDLKIRRRFYKYLGCDKLAAIAERAGVTKQNIQKQFTRIINKMAKMMSGKNQSGQINLPHKFKKMYLDLKPSHS
jgi:hypothetical protein